MSLALSLSEIMAVAAIAGFVLPRLSPARTGHRICVAVAGIALVLRYLAWRLDATLPPPGLDPAALVQWTYFALELCVMYLAVRYLLLITRMRNRSADATRNQSWLAGLPRAPRVDILVPTCNEPAALLERTIVGILGLDYPNTRLWVLDDGGRPWLEAFCRERGVRYLARGDRRFAKAGNLNNGLAQIAAEGEPPGYIAVFDADFVPYPRFLRRVLALFRDERIGLVQTPQYFFNSGPFQYNFMAERIWPEELLNQFDVGFPARDARGTVNCCGTSFVMRWEALQQIGNFPTEAVVEDLLATLKLRAHGWEVAYLHERLSAGLAATGLGEYITQHSRWCLGAVQVFRGKWGFFSRRPVPLRDRLNLLDHFAFWAVLMPFNLLKLAVPPLYWTSGLFVMRTDLAAFIGHFLPLAIALTSATSWVSRGRYIPFADRVSQIVIALSTIRSVAAGLLCPRDRPFRMTPKDLVRERGAVHWPLLGCFIAIAIASSGSAVLALASGREALWQRDTTIIVLFITAADLFLLMTAALACIERPQRRREDRFGMDEETTVRIGAETRTARIANLSTIGARIRCGNPPPAGSPCVVTIDGVGDIEAVARRVDRHGFTTEFRARGLERVALIRKLYCGRSVTPVESYRTLPVICAVLGRASEIFRAAAASLTGLYPRNPAVAADPHPAESESAFTAPAADETISAASAP